jgi:Flp pilus assembly protein TadD
LTKNDPFQESFFGPNGSRMKVDPVALLEHARSDYAGNRPKAAVHSLRRLLTIHPNHVDALVIIAAAFAKVGAVGKANAIFNRVNKLDVTESRHWQAHASVSVQGQRLNAAHTLSRKILVKEPADVAGSRTLARVASMRGHHDDTRRHLWHLRSLLPNDPTIATGLARSAMIVGTLEDAETLCRRAVELSKGNAERLFDLGRVLRAQGKLKEADVVLDQAVNLDISLVIPRKVVRETAIEDDFRATGEQFSDV